MRLLSHVAEGEERLAVALGEAAIDVVDLLDDGPWTMARLLTDPGGAGGRIHDALGGAGPRAGRPIADLHLLPPVPHPRQIIAVGRNYREHAAEEAAALPEAPLLFAKLPGSLVGDGQPVTWSAGLTSEVDYEAELAVVIGTTARNVAVGNALEHVLGYACLNDVSARDLQRGDGQWTRAKGLDTFCPMGPWLVTAEEVPDPGALRIQCRINGEPRQDATTGDLVHGVAELIAHCSNAFTLEPGDIIATGTPGGVGAFRNPPTFLRDGDVMEVEIERIGVLRNRCQVVP